MSAKLVRRAVVVVLALLASPLAQPSWALPSCCRSRWSAAGCPYCSSDEFRLAFCDTWDGDGSCRCRTSAIWGICEEGGGSCTYTYGETCPIIVRPQGGDAVAGKGYAYHPFFRPLTPAMPAAAGLDAAERGHVPGQ